MATESGNNLQKFLPLHPRSPYDKKPGPGEARRAKHRFPSVQRLAKSRPKAASFFPWLTLKLPSDSLGNFDLLKPKQSKLQLLL